MKSEELEPTVVTPLEVLQMSSMSPVVKNAISSSLQGQPEKTNGSELTECTTPSTQLPPRPVPLLSREPQWRKHWLRFEESNKQLELLATWSEFWIKRAALNDSTSDKPRWMVISGPTGTGKTHIMEHAYKYFRFMGAELWHPKAWRKGPPTFVYFQWVKIASKQHQQWDDVVSDIRDADIVMLDDVGVTAGGFKASELMCRIQDVLDTCKRKWLLITTNIEKEDWPKLLGERVSDRLRYATTVKTKGLESFRARGDK